MGAVTNQRVIERRTCSWSIWYNHHWEAVTLYHDLQESYHLLDALHVCRHTGGYARCHLNARESYTDCNPISISCTQKLITSLHDFISNVLSQLYSHTHLKE